jgi:hypothetical protein
MTWTALETNTHQDHVIAHVIGATPLGHFIWDETAYIVLDIGFIWNIYLDMEMGLVPHRVAISELEADDETKKELSEVRNVESSPIESVELFENGDERRLLMNCETERLVIETSLSHGWTRITAFIRG